MHLESKEVELMFYFCSYWQSWSRVLSSDHPKGPFIEVNLTPSGSYSSTWEDRVAPIRIRAHGTARDPERDKVVDQLPEEVVQAMTRELGAELTERLLTEDFLSQIDWDLYRQKCNGGANLENIRLR